VTCAPSGTLMGEIPLPHGVMFIVYVPLNSNMPRLLTCRPTRHRSRRASEPLHRPGQHRALRARRHDVDEHIAFEVRMAEDDELARAVIAASAIDDFLRRATEQDWRG
jgi:hypothetical protein